MFINHQERDEARGSVVSASEYKSEDPGFDPLAERGEGPFFLSFRINSCADWFAPEPSSSSRVLHAPKFVRVLKIPYPTVVKEYASQPAGGMVRQKILHTLG